MAKGYVDELFGCSELDDILECDGLELGADPSALAKAAAAKMFKKSDGKSALMKGLTTGGLGQAGKDVAKVAGSAVKTVAQVVKTVGKPLVAVAGNLPVIGGLVKAGAQALTEIDKATGLTKTVGAVQKLTGGLAGKGVSAALAAANKPVGIAKTAKPAANKKVAAVRSVATPAPLLAAAAPVPMSQPATPLTVTVRPYGSGSPSTSDLVAKIEAQFGTELAQVAERVRLMSLQNQATSEHRGKLKEETFKRNLVAMLRQIASNTG